MNHQHSNHQTLVLSENDQGVLCKCKGCRMYTLAYKTIVIPFEQKAFYTFEQVLRQLKAEDFNMYHPQGFKSVIRNNQADLSISLTFGEVQELLNLYQEARLMDDVFSILST